MKDFDFGYFGTGDEGYAQYMTAFGRNFKSELDTAFLEDDETDTEDCSSGEVDFDEDDF